MKHGAGIYSVAKELGCSSDKIVDFSSNINLYTPKVKTLEFDVVRYADSSYSDLKKVIAKTLDIKRDQIKLYNGATSAIFELIKAIDKSDIYLYTPLYGEYEEAAKLYGKKIHKIDRFKSISNKPKQNSTVVFVNPSTPDGKYYNLKKLFKLWVKLNCTIILDESFLEFEELKSFRDKIVKYKNLFIIQSFTKFYSCAGVRVGAILSHRKNISKLQHPIWNLSSFDVAFLTDRLKDVDFKINSIKKHKKQKAQLYKILKNSNRFDKILDSDTNFILVYSKSSDIIFDKLLKNRVLVRKCGSFDNLDDNWLRFAVKNKKANKKLKKLLSKRR